VLCRQGTIRSRRDGAGAYVVSSRELERFARTYAPKRPNLRRLTTRTDRLAQRVFRMFAEGETDLRTIVIETACSPTTARELWAEWRTSFTDGERLALAQEAERQRAAELDRAEKREARRLELEAARETRLAEARILARGR